MATRASRERVADLERILSQVRQLQSPGPLQTRTLTGPPTIPTHCLACNQELPFGQSATLPSGATTLAPVSTRHQLPHAPGAGAGASGRLAADVARRSKQLYAQESQSPQRLAMQAQLQQLADADAAGQTASTPDLAPVRPPSSGTTGDGAPLVRPGSAPFKPPVMRSGSAKA